MAKKKSRFRSAGNNDDLLAQTEESYKTRESSGKYQSYLTGLTKKQWKPGDGDHCFSIIPWIAGDQHPQRKEGQKTYCLDLWVHTRIGVNENNYLCPARNYGKPCPICEAQAELRKQDSYDEDEVKALSPKRRVVYNVVVYDSAAEEEQGVMVWEASHYLTEAPITAIAKNRRTGGFIPFSDPDNGKDIEFTKSGTGIGTKYTGHKFTDRDGVISDEILDEALTLDQFLDIKTYDELNYEFTGETAESDEYEEVEEEEIEEELEEEELEEEELEEEELEEDDELEDEEEEQAKKPVRRSRKSPPKSEPDKSDVPKRTITRRRKRNK